MQLVVGVVVERVRGSKECRFAGAQVAGWLAWGEARERERAREGERRKKRDERRDEMAQCQCQCSQ